MPKRRADGRDAGTTAKRRHRPHLYLVTDDWRWGYSIRKVVDLYPDSDDEAEMIDYTELRLPPAVVRVEAPRGTPRCFTSGPGGTTIVAMHPTWDSTHPLVPRRLVTAFDVRTRAVAYGPRPSRSPDRGRGASSRCRRSTPDGRAIFFSTFPGWSRGAAAATFSFDASEDDEEEGRLFRWTRHGEWALPFAGPAHYDRALDAWVGLANDPGAFGHVCACDVVPPDAVSSSSRSYVCACERLLLSLYYKMYKL
ncbi:hypothetical protein QOZ80_3BG0261530 [Eleusine coracana subsp. coracana]|nr:hypothetical protein QOZ80_3BG0261530 [Eleusine coracana subsp. coracana]